LRALRSLAAIAFRQLREALLTPLRPGSKVAVISSDAALAGSPLSRGYAGANGTQHGTGIEGHLTGQLAARGWMLASLPRKTAERCQAK
jgi:hypothetical protein